MAVRTFMPIKLKESSNIAKAAHDGRNLKVTYKSNKKEYIYEAVPPNVVVELAQAESVGKYFNEHIRDRYFTKEVKPKVVKKIAKGKKTK